MPWSDSGVRLKLHLLSIIPIFARIHDVGEQDGQAFIAMEFLEGATLKHRIAGRPLD